MSLCFFYFFLLAPLSMSGVFVLETNQTFAATKVFSINWSNETHECVNIHVDNITGKYVLLDPNPYSNLIENKSGLKADVMAVQKRGAIGALFISEYINIGSPGMLFPEDNDIVIPVAEVSYIGEVLYGLVKNNNSIHINVTSDPNEFIIFVNSIGKKVYQGTMVAWWFGISILGVIKLVQILLHKGTLNLAIICLCLELIALILHTLQMIINPMRWGETFPSIPIPNSYVLLTIFFPFEISAAVFLIFFWLDMATIKIRESYKLLGRFQNISIAVCCLLFLMEGTLDTLSTTVGLPSIINFLSGIYIGIALFLAIVYHIVGVKLWLYSEKIMRGAQMRKLTMKIQFSGLMIIFSAILGTAQVIWDRTPTESAIVWGLIWFFLGCKSIAQILVFGTPKRKPESSVRSVQSTQ